MKTIDICFQGNYHDINSSKALVTINKLPKHSKSKSGKISDLESHLGFWLRFVSNQVSANFKRLVEENGMSISEWVALRYLFNQESATALELIDALGMTKGAISKIITRLENKRLVKRITVDDDKRAQQLSLTTSGQQLVPKLASLADQNDELFFGHMSKQQQTELFNMMKRICQIHGLKQFPTD